MQVEYDYVFKILLIGNSNVGKSSILIRFSDGVYDHSSISTVGVDLKYKTVNIDNKLIKLHIWDTAGQSMYDAFRMSYYRGTHGIIIVYDVTDRDSFDGIKKWIDECNRNNGASIRLLVGNKCDDKNRRKVHYNEGKNLADEHGYIFTETSAKYSTNITDTFINMTKILLNNVNNLNNCSGQNKIVLQKTPKKIHSSCC